MVLPVYFSSSVRAVALAIEDTRIFCLSGPSSIKSPATNCVENAVPFPERAVVCVVIATLPEIPFDQAVALAHTETFKEFPSSPGYLATHSPTPEIPVE